MVVHAILAVVALALLPASTSQARPRTAESAVRGYFAARSLSARAKFLAPDYRYWFLEHMGPGETAAEHLKPGWDTELHCFWRVDSLAAEAGRVTVHVHEANDFSLLLGHPGWDAITTCAVDARNRITTEFYEPLPGAPSWRPYLARALPWLRAHRAPALARTFPDGKLVETTATAREWRAMLRAWRAAVSPDSTAVRSRR